MGCKRGNARRTLAELWLTSQLAAMIAYRWLTSQVVRNQCCQLLWGHASSG